MEEEKKFDLYSEINKLPDDIKKEVLKRVADGDVGWLGLKAEEIVKMIEDESTRQGDAQKHKDELRAQFNSLMNKLSEGMIGESLEQSKVIFGWQEKTILIAFSKLYESGYVPVPIPDKLLLIDKRHEYSGQSGDSFECGEYVFICENEKPFFKAIMKLRFDCVDGSLCEQGIEWICIFIPIHEFNQGKKEFVFKGASVYFLDQSSVPLINSANYSVRELENKERYVKYFSHAGAMYINDWNRNHESWKELRFDFDVAATLEKGDLFIIIKHLQERLNTHELKDFFKKYELGFRKEAPNCIYYKEKN